MDEDEGSPADGCFLGVAMGGVLWIAIWKIGNWLWTISASTP
jgi:hypothetical protein